MFIAKRLKGPAKAKKCFIIDKTAAEFSFVDTRKKIFLVKRYVSSKEGEKGFYVVVNESFTKLPAAPTMAAVIAPTE